MISLKCGIYKTKQINKIKQNPDSQIQETDSKLPEGRWGNKMGEGDQEVQTSSYETHKSWQCKVQHGEYSQ